MKKLLTIFVLGMVLMSCDESKPKHPDIWIHVNGQRYLVIVIDGCQYLSYEGYCDKFTHKGNCNNPIHQRLLPVEKDSVHP